jgi:Spy/CpxP family protein refolding chaperone
MKTRLMTIVLGLFVIVGSALAQTDQPQTRPMQKWRNSRDLGALKLTDQQKKDIQKIKFDLMQKQIDLRAKVAHACLDYQQLVSADSPDESAIAAKINDIAQLRVQLKKNMLDGWFAINKILTPDQQKIWKKVLQHPRRARGMMLRMRANRTDGDNGMMRWRRMPNVGAAPMMEGGPILGEATDSETDLTDDLGPLADIDILTLDDESFLDDLDMFNWPMMDMMGRGSTMGNRSEIMKRLMDQGVPPNPPSPDVSK